MTLRKATNLSWVWMLAALAPWTGAGAGTVIGHCVSTAQQLQNALTSASNGGQYNGMDNRIKIVGGLYQTTHVTNPSPGTFYYQNDDAAGDLSIEGGYNSDCSGRSSDPLATLIDGDFQYQVMDLRSAHGRIKVSGVTIENGESTFDGGGLHINGAQAFASPVQVFNTVVRSNHTTMHGGGVYISSEGAGNLALVHNVLVIDNSADEGFSGIEVIGNGDGVAFHDNTVTANSSLGGSSGSVYVSSAASSCEVTNNILDRNGSGGVEINCPSGTLAYNDIGDLTGAGGTTQTGNVDVDPQFVDPANGDFHLASTSTLFGLSPLLVNDGSDIDGAPYPATGRQDIGAYEDTVFTDGFGD